MNKIIFFPLKVLLIGLDLLITLVSFGWIGAVKKAMTSEPLRTVPVGDDAAHRVRQGNKGALVTSPREGVATVHDLAADAFTRYAPHRCMGVREFLGWKTPKVKHFGDTKWMTFEEVGILSAKFGAALREEGLVAAPGTATLGKIETPSAIAIFENTCPEWLVAALGAFSQSIIVTTIYATLGLEAVIDAVTEGNISAIVCNKANVEKLADRIEEMPTLSTIIYTNDLVAPDDKISIPAAPTGVRIVEFEAFCESGNITAFPPTPPMADTCAVIMYTSGSTGKPKGVVITHRQSVAACAGFEMALGLRTGEDVYLGYLPLAHILELSAQFCMLCQGCTICYADPKSLTSTGAYPIGALEQYSPTVMAAVPKIWDVIKKGVQTKIAASPLLARFLVQTAFEARTFAIKYGYDTPLFKALVFKKFSQIVGGKLRFALSGGGPLNSEVQEFIRTCFCCGLVQGYGLTETCAGTTIQAGEDIRPNIAGVALPSIEIKLVSTPDITDKAGQPYMSTDRMDHAGNHVFGRGEILVRGGNVTLGYYQMQDKTKEDYRADGFFHTGDIGQFMSDGSLQIVDRKKNLVKLKAGEYIALEKMEMIYGNSTFVDALAGGLCCYGDGDMNRPVALVQLSERATMKWAKSTGFAGDFNKVKNSSELYDAVMESFLVEHKKGGLSVLEKLVGFAIMPEHWTPENGCLTAANKLQRRAVIRRFPREFKTAKAKGTH